MRLYVDTSNYEDLSIRMSEKEKEAGPATAIEEFCYAMASFIVDFSKVHLGCNKDSVRSSKELCLSCINTDVDLILDEIE